MTRYSTFKYGTGVKYGASSTSTPRWGFVVDWDGDGFYEGTNEAQYMTGLVIDRGRDYYIAASSDGFEPMAVGRATVTLSNKNGRFNPYNVASPLYPNIDIGKFCQIVVKYLTTTYKVFTGVIVDIQMTGLNDTVTIIIEDGIGWLTNQVGNPYPSPITTDSQAGVPLYKLLVGARWPSLWGMDFGNGSDFYYFHWATGGNTWEEIRKLLDSELAYYCVKNDGRFWYRSRQLSDSAVLSLTQDLLGKDVYIPTPWEFRKNIIKFYGNTVAASTEKIIWQSSGDISVAPGATISITAEFSNPALPNNHNSWTAFDQSGGVGADLTGNITVVYSTTYSTSAVLSITNTGGTLAYINLLKLYGYEYTLVAVSGSASGTGSTTRPRSLQMNLNWNQNQNALNDIATQMLAFLNTTQPFPVIEIDNRPDIQFTPDLLDVVAVNIAAIGLNSNFRVGSIRHEWVSETGQATKTTFHLEPYRAYTGYWSFDGNAILNTSLLGW